MKNNTKKWLTVAGSLAVCAVLVVLIGTQFQKEQPKDTPLPQNSSQPSDVTVNSGTDTQNKDVVVTPPEIPASSQPIDNGAVASGIEQTIQADPVKPKEPEKPKTPDGIDRTPSTEKDHSFTPESPDVPPTYKPEDTDKKPTPPADPPKQNTGGNNIPGFDNVPDGGANQVIEVDGAGDINKQVGTMD